MTIILHVHDWDELDWLKNLSGLMPDRNFLSYSQIENDIQADYAILWKPPAQLFEQIDGLKAIFSLGAGVDHIVNVAGFPKDVPLVRVVDKDLTNRMSEYVVFHCLRYLRQYSLLKQQQTNKIWHKGYQPSANEVRVGVLGLGELGLDAAQKLRVMGFNVLGWSRSEKSIDGVKCFHGPDGLDTMLAQTDILVSLLPLTPQTDGLLDYELFAKLPTNGALGGPYLINVGRGQSQREAGILKALDDGTLAGATLDVFEVEPLPTTSKLWTHPNVTITPHNGADSSPRAICQNIADQIARFEAGLLLENVVSIDRGY